MESEGRPNRFVNPTNLAFLWLELTGHCNLNCDHCYGNFGQHLPLQTAMTFDDWLGVIASAAELNCPRVQFIGGEPTLVPELPAMIAYAHRKGIPHLEVFTNATKINDKLISCFKENQVNVAVSLYSVGPKHHDELTQVPGSHASTLEAIKSMHAVGIPLRIAVIAFEHTMENAVETVEFVKSLGIANVGIDMARAFGRAAAATKRKTQMSELCGNCWKGSLCVMSNGIVSPCIMSRRWAVGSVKRNSLPELIESLELARVRKQIYEQAYVPKEDELEAMAAVDGESACLPGPCFPGDTCSPSICYPASGPCSPACSPQNCMPGTGPCYPIGR